jgi:hypothetical protein
MQIIESHKDDPDDNVTEKMMMWMKQEGEKARIYTCIGEGEIQ